jgi:hypothetical protein
MRVHSSRQPRHAAIAAVHRFPEKHCMTRHVVINKRRA